MIEDWELGALYWNCFERYGQDEDKANQLVRQKYFDEFIQKDIHLFLGTTFEYHLRLSPNPFIVVGVFVPPKPKLAIQEQTTFKADGIQQQKLFDQYSTCGAASGNRKGQYRTINENGRDMYPT